MRCAPRTGAQRAETAERRPRRGNARASGEFRALAVPRVWIDRARDSEGCSEKGRNSRPASRECSSCRRRACERSLLQAAAPLRSPLRSVPILSPREGHVCTPRMKSLLNPECVRCAPSLRLPALACGKPAASARSFATRARFPQAVMQLRRLLLSRSCLWQRVEHVSVLTHRKLGEVRA